MYNNQPSTTGYKPASSASLRKYVQIVLARKWLVLLTCLAALGATFYSSRGAKPFYQAQVLMMRAEPAGNLNIASLDKYIETPFSESIQGHTELLNSSSSIAKIREKLEKEHNLEFTEWDIKGQFSLSSEDDYRSQTRNQRTSPIVRLTAKADTPMRAQALANTIAEVYIQTISEMKKADLTRGLTFLQEQMNSVNEKIEAVEETLSKVRQKDKAIFIPQVDSSSSQLSNDLSNNLKEMETELSKTEMDIDWTEAQLQSVRNSISQEEHVSSSSSFPPQVGQIQAKLVETQLQLDSMRENFTEKDPQVVSLQRQVDALKKRLDAELAEIRNNAPNSTYSLSELQNLMQQSVLLDVKLKGLEQKKALLEQNIATFQKEHPDLITEQMELTSLERQARVHEQTYMMLLEKYEEMSLLKQMEMSRLQILDKAKLPEVIPIPPQKNILLLLSLVLGLGLGVGIAFFLEYLDDSIKLKEDVEAYLALPIIGVIPKVKPFKIPNSALNGRGNLAASKSVVSNPKGNLSSSKALPSTAHNSKASNPAVLQKAKSGKRGNGKKRNPKHLKKLLSHILLFAEQKSPVITDYRTLATNIMNADVDTPIKTLLIASAAPNEGKTSIVTNLAISLAQMGQKVLLWDADLRRQRIHRIFQQGNSPGLTDFLVDENKSSEDYPLSEDYHLGEPFIRSTEVENLYIFPSGRYVSNPEMLLSSEKMKQLVKSLTSEYDIILFDSSPLLSAADAMTLATSVDRTLMVIRSGETKRQVALQGKELLENVNAEVLGVVLNGIDYSKQYGSYYHSYRSYYSGNEKEE